MDQDRAARQKRFRVAPSKREQATCRSAAAGPGVGVELMEQTRESPDAYLGATARKPGEFLSLGVRQPLARHNCTAVYAAGLPVDRCHRARRKLLRDALAAPKPRRRSSTAAPATCARSSFRLATGKWKVRSVTSESRSMMRLPSPSKLKSEVSGQSGHCSARLLEALRADIVAKVANCSAPIFLL